MFNRNSSPKQAVAELVCKVYKSIKEQEEPGQNVIFSPLGLSTTLGMLYTASRGPTSTELRPILSRMTKKLAKQAFSEALGFLERRTYDGELHITSHLFASTKYPLAGSAHRKITVPFNSGASTADFTDSLETIMNIKEWFDNNTAAKVNGIAVDISPEETSAVIVSAIYFKSGWRFPFDVTKTVTMPFHVYKTTTVNVKMMKVSGSFRTANDDKRGVRILELPYAERGFTMMVILPDDIDGVNGVEEEIQTKPQFFEELEAKLTPQLIEVQVPKFRCEAVIDYVGPLQEAGVQSLFRSKKADIGRIVDNAHISSFLQPVVVEINEHGTSGQAKPGVAISLEIGGESFVANRPFVFAIRKDGYIIYTGCVRSPLPVSA